MIESQSSKAKVLGTAPIIEIMSPRAGSGKTNLLYHLIATAVLPFHLGGRQAAVVLLDTDNHFSANRLAQQTRKSIVVHTGEDFLDSESLDQVVLDSLKHVHVLRPQSLAATIATLNNLPTYLFDATRHYSFDRAISFIALDSASSFYWQSRSDAEDAALQASLNKSKAPAQHSQPQPSGYIQLAASLKNASRILSTPVIFTSQDFNPPTKTTNPPTSSVLGGPDPRSLRPALPPPWPSLPTLRLVVRRAPVRSLPFEVTVEEALRETEMRQKVVALGKFECFVNEWGLEERVRQKLREKGDMFEFFVTEEGVRVGDGPE